MPSRRIFRGPPAPLGAAVLVLAVITSGCSAAGSSGTGGTGAAAASSTSPASASPSARVCPNAEGDACVGALTAGTTYRTTVFSPRTSYSVTEPGWSNLEDTPGNFLLLPPGNDLPGVNAGTSDFIGVYTSVAPSAFVAPPDCAARLVPGIASTPQAMLTWMQRQPSITVTTPVAASVGGLTGWVVDVAVRPGARLPVCTEGADTFSVALLFSGVTPSSLDHGVIPGMTMRLFLLAYRGGVLAIELDDIATAPGTLDSLTSEARRLRFTT